MAKQVSQARAVLPIRCLARRRLAAPIDKREAKTDVKFDLENAMKDPAGQNNEPAVAVALLDIAKADKTEVTTTRRLSDMRRSTLVT